MRRVRARPHDGLEKITVAKSFTDHHSTSMRLSSRTVPSNDQLFKLFGGDVRFHGSAIWGRHGEESRSFEVVDATLVQTWWLSARRIERARIENGVVDLR